MITEFLGLPGSGKSTLARYLAARNGGEAVTVNGYAYESSTSRIRSIINYPRLVLAAASIDWRSAINLCRRNTIVSNLDQYNTWIEDGPLYAVSRMAIGNMNTSKISNVLAHLRLPSRCVVVDASADTCLYRLVEMRHATRFTRMAREDALAALTSQISSVNKVVKCLPETVEIIRIDNDYSDLSLTFDNNPRLRALL